MAGGYHLTMLQLVLVLVIALVIGFMSGVSMNVEPFVQRSRYACRDYIDMSKYMLKTECPPQPNMNDYVHKSKIPPCPPCICGCSKPCKVGKCPPCPRPRCPPQRQMKCPDCPACPAIQPPRCPEPEVIIKEVRHSKPWSVRPALDPIGGIYSQTSA